MEIITLAIAGVSLLSALLSNWNVFKLQARLHELDLEMEDIINLTMVEMVKSQQYREDINLKVEDYGNFTERLLKNMKK